MLYILLCGFPPFYGDEDEEMFELIRRATYAFPEDIDGYQTTWGGISAQAKGLIRQLLCVDPRERLSAAAVGKHEWVSSRVSRTPRSWMGKMRERSSSGCTARNSGAIRAQFGRNSAQLFGDASSLYCRWASKSKKEGDRADRGQIDRGAAVPAAAAGSTAPKKINVDSKMVGAGDSVAAREGEVKMGHTLQQKGVVNQFSRWIVDRMFNKREMRILMVGLDASGKTSILYRLKLGKPKKTIPTIGFNVETLEYKNIAFTVWDVGGQEKLRALWRHYFANTQARGAILRNSAQFF